MIVIEYSASQKAFNTCDLDELLRINLINAIKGKSNDYQMVGFTESHEQANKFIQDLRDSFKELR